MPGKTPVLHVGCSGWGYGHWRGVFYAPGSGPSTWFGQYSKNFSTVEINSTFYALPGSGTVLKWREQAPYGFIYSVKANRYITHMKKLKGPELALRKMLDLAEGLGPHLGPMLFQLPPRWSADPERLDGFCRVLPKRYRYVLEFRDPSWYTGEVFSILARYGNALCLHDMPGSVSPREMTGSFCYIRLHGQNGAYEGAYSTDTLREWARYVRSVLRSGKDVYIYFNNDLGGHAPRDAGRFLAELGGV